ncbi:MAG TPA: LUD domain-containing protein [Puia sp.]|jgi:L-lactate dehydrogenase complex protein LldG|nr:LUD domain-containing protein [Puia sp.]
MNVSSGKENILKKIRKALSESTPIPFPQSEGNHSVYQPSRQELEVEFAEQFTRLQGKFVFCIDFRELVAQLTALAGHQSWKKIVCREEKLQTLLKGDGFSSFAEGGLAECDAAITSCEALIARTGSIVMSTGGGNASGRTVSVYAPVHICIAWSDQLVYDIRDSLVALKEKYQQQIPSLITFATGPSRTADIEKTLVVGVHGPREVYLFLVDRR